MKSASREQLVTSFNAPNYDAVGSVMTKSILKAFDHSSIGILYIGFGRDIRCYNRKLLEILNLTILDPSCNPPTYQELITYVAKTIKNSKDIEGYFGLPIKDYYQKQELIVETYNNRVLLCSSQPVIEDGLIDGVVWSVNDITEHKTQERIATYRSLHDALTQLPNRTYLFNKLEKLTNRNRNPKKKFALMFLDLDDFKCINDKYGHAVGDQFLISCANRIRNSLRVPDTLARLSGDEFVVILDEIAEPDLVEKVINRIYNSLSNSFNVSGVHISASVSIGISSYPAQSIKPRELIRLADKAMYEAKKEGKNTFCFYNASMES